MSISDATLTLLDEVLAKMAADGIQSVQDKDRIVNRIKAMDLIALDEYLTAKNAKASSGNIFKVEFENPE